MRRCDLESDCSVAKRQGARFNLVLAAISMARSRWWPERGSCRRLAADGMSVAGGRARLSARHGAKSLPCRASCISTYVHLCVRGGRSSVLSRHDLAYLDGGGEPDDCEGWPYALRLHGSVLAAYGDLILSRAVDRLG